MRNTDASVVNDTNPHRREGRVYFFHFHLKEVIQ